MIYEHVHTNIVKSSKKTNRDTTHIAKYKIYKHYRNKKTYLVEDFCKIQVNGEWVDAVIYSDEADNKFVRSLSEFEEKFEEVK